MELFLEKISNHVVRNRVALSVFVFFVIVMPLFVYLEAATSLLSWILALAVVRFLGRVYQRFVSDRDYFTNILFLSYIGFSIFGLVMAFDNYQNFGEVFGSRHDDSDFFYTIVDIIHGRNADIEKWLFEYFFAGIGFVLSGIHYYRDLHLFDLIPFTWAFAALVVALSAEMVQIIAGKKAPYWIMFVTLLGNLVFVRNNVLFYRESMLLALAFSGWLFFLRRRTSGALLFTILAGFLRGANAMLSSFFFLLVHLQKSFRMRFLRKAYILFFLLLIVAYSTIKPTVDQYAFVVYSWARPFDVAAVTQERLYGSNMSDIIELRQYDAENRSTGGRIAARAGGFVKIGIDIIMYMFFPIAFHPLIVSARHGSVDQSFHIDDGFFVFNLFEWGMVLFWVLVIPYLLYGLYRAAKQSDNIYLTSSTILYISTVLVMAIFRGHTRHALYFIALNPIFVTYAYYYAKGDYSSKRSINLLKFVVLLVIIGYNIFKYF